MVPVCRACPENTYQDRPGGRACRPCPANHITASTGAKSRNDCIGMLKAIIAGSKICYFIFYE